MKFSPKAVLLALITRPVLSAPMEDGASDTTAMADTISHDLNADDSRGVILCPDTVFSPTGRKSSPIPPFPLLSLRYSDTHH
jgi:hypothetical protein